MAGENTENLHFLTIFMPIEFDKVDAIPSNYLVT